ncbi:hypothetical protein ACKI1I_36560 [Streptomyces turgidiscabies]|uniref:Uncharacterized protein n=1 Tax=Streptomyces turgidiscabies (strain Car8) TaxID=698760 RepID=L7F2Q0_STRT8|nr:MULTISPECIES: hypothetical protein [Streptomyces]ELP65419.1 hypothetical protein STRTUCAR8_04023 [Streptomyces turgidiscabies Car8]MDX3497703.1 hypothetical protein [Streptomyces turgidiscabies]
MSKFSARILNQLGQFGEAEATGVRLWLIKQESSQATVEGR